MYSKGKEEGRRKREEGRRKRKEEGGRLLSQKKSKFPVNIYPWVYTNDTNGHDMTSYKTLKALPINTSDF
ncbi:MAG: hypothetical protein F6K17_24065 [Okeania sp. SIO3C4]|nr:hypothetical protein [Okeania sp. SIO3C4]